MSFLQALLTSEEGPFWSVIGALIALLGVASTCVAYNIFFHPLSKIPGPWLFASSRLPYIWCVINGRLAVKLHELHEIYGPVVRTASNEVSFIDPKAWDVIYGTQNSRRQEFPKNYDTWNETVNNFTKTLFLASSKDHPRMRKILSTAFSEKVLHSKDALFRQRIDVFLRHISSASQNREAKQGQPDSTAVDFNQWFNWLAFDTVSDFVLGQNFDCVGSPENRPWLTQLSMTWHFISILSSIKSLGRIKNAVLLFVPRKWLQTYVDQLQLVGRTALRRLNAKPPQPTLMSIARAAPKEREPGRTRQAFLSDKEVLSNAELMVTAGTDTSATALPATIYFLLMNPTKWKRVVEEVRSFDSENHINTRTIERAVYLAACIHEAMRLYAPVAEGLPRVCPGVGEEICGYWIPGGSFCQISPYAANLSSSNFENAKQFMPERWLDADIEASDRFQGDSKEAYRPFSVGPRDCIGRRFALLSMRLTLCRLIYRFDLQRAWEDDWLDQRCYLLWCRKPLMVKLRPVERSAVES